MLEIVIGHVSELRWPGFGPSKKSARLRKLNFNKEQCLIDLAGRTEIIALFFDSHIFST